MTHTSILTASRHRRKTVKTTVNSYIKKSVKGLFLLLLTGSIMLTAHATSYTTAAAGDLNNKANWTPAPPNFTTQGDTWNVTMTMSVPTMWAVTGNVTISTGGSIKDMGNTVYFGGHFTNNAEPVSYVATGTAVFNSEFPQAIGGTATTTFNNLTRSNNGLSFNAGCIITGNFIGKSLVIDGGNTITFGGDFTVTIGNNLFTGSAVFNGKKAQSVTGNPGFNNLVINNAAGLAFNSPETIVGNLELNAGTLSDGGNAVSVSGNIIGEGKATGTGGITITGSSATISGATIDNLTLDNAKGFSLMGNTTINGALTFKTGALIIGSNTLTLKGTVSGMDAAKSLTGNGSANLVIGTTHELGTLYFDQGTPGTSNNIATLTMSGKDGTVTLGNKLVISNALALNEGTIADGGNTIFLAGNITGKGTETGTGGITMTGSSATISGITIDKLTLNNATDFSLTGSPNVRSLNFTTGTLTIGSNTLNLNGTVSGMSATNYLTGSAASNVTIGNNDAINTLFFDQSSDGVSNNIAALTVNGTRCNIVKLGSKLVSGTSVTLSKGQLQINGQTLVLNGTFAGSTSDNIQGSSSSNLVINAKTNLGPLYFDENTKGVTNNLAQLIIDGGTTTLGSTLHVSAELALNGGTLADGGNTISVTGNITGTGTETGSSGILLTGASSTISGITINNLTLNVSAGAGLTGNLVVSNTLTFNAGKLNIGSNTLTLNGTVAGMSAKNCFTGSESSNLTIGCSGALGNVYFDQSGKGITNVLSACNISNENASVTFSNQMLLGSPAHDQKHHKRKKQGEVAAL
jgi:fibronectin-binding autotransporter adhesin